MRKFFFFFLTIIFSSCSRLAVEDSISQSFQLVNHNGERKIFPDDYRNKILLAGYIYTHCPDICPMTVQNMQRVSEKFSSDEKISFLVVSFDPERDSVSAMKNFAEAYGLNNDPRWDFLTGRKSSADSVMSRLGIITKRSFEQNDKKKNSFYNISHTDRITLIDGAGNIRHTYSGSKADVEEIAQDIKTLLSE